MTSLSQTFGIAARNFTAYPEMPDAHAWSDYGVRMEQLGFDSLWVWDHILLGVDPNFPILEFADDSDGNRGPHEEDQARHGHSRSAAAQSGDPGEAVRHGPLSDGRLIMGMASGWYKREFDAVGVPFDKRGKIMDENLEILTRLWTEDMVKGEFMFHEIPAARDVPEAGPEAAAADSDRRLCRPCAQARRRRPATAGSPISIGRRALRNRGRRFAASPRKPARTPTSCSNASQLPIGRQVARCGRERDDGVAREGVGLRLLERIDQGQRHHGHRR